MNVDRRMSNKEILDLMVEYSKFFIVLNKVWIATKMATWI